MTKEENDKKLWALIRYYEGVIALQNRPPPYTGPVYISVIKRPSNVSIEDICGVQNMMAPLDRWTPLFVKRETNGI